MSLFGSGCFGDALILSSLSLCCNNNVVQLKGCGATDGRHAFLQFKLDIVQHRFTLKCFENMCLKYSMECPDQHYICIQAGLDFLVYKKLYHIVKFHLAYCCLFVYSSPVTPTNDKSCIGSYILFNSFDIVI